jgi:hypothetical protein
MKDNTLAKIFAVSAACALAASGLAQTTTSVTTNVEPGSAELTTSTGSFATYTPGGEYFTFRTSTGAEPVKYYYTKDTTIVDPAGQTVAWSDIRPEVPATVYYARQGERMVVRKVVLAKPVSVIEKKETTTTTTTRP